MSFDKNDRVKVKSKSGEMNGVIKDRFIQNTELEYEGSTVIASASEEHPVYLVEFDNGEKEMIAENAIRLDEN